MARKKGRADLLRVGGNKAMAFDLLVGEKFYIAFFLESWKSFIAESLVCEKKYFIF